MKERPILFSAPMVRAILDGAKTQTRRLVKPAPPIDFNLSMHVSKTGHLHAADYEKLRWSDPERVRWDCPYGQPGDRLWVRETLQYDSEVGHYYAATAAGSLGNPSGRHWVAYEKEITGKEIPDRQIPSIHMPRWASRITLEITGVRVERLQDISEADAIAEGITKLKTLRGSACQIDGGPVLAGGPILAYRDLWESINGPGSWDENPWVWAIEFKKVTP